MDIKEFNLEELTEYLKEMGEPSFRAKQVFSWIHEKCVASGEEMTNLPKKLREELTFTRARIKKIQTSKDGTRKFLLELSDGNLIECVLMEYDYGLSACISTQVGCAMHCSFCASGMEGLVRDLSCGEIIEEIYAIVRAVGKRISRVVFMGMGEPLLNYDNVIKAISLLSDPNGQNISPRHMTLSTCGIVPGIKRLADENIPVTLALSLHATTQEKREEIMPIAKKYNLKEVIEACDYYRKKSGRRITYEYCLQKGVNDTKEDIQNLYNLLKKTDGHINIIPLHEVKNLSEKKPGDALEFKKGLEKKGITVTIRRELGKDIDGACGQLRLSQLHSKEN